MLSFLILWKHPKTIKKADKMPTQKAKNPPSRENKKRSRGYIENYNPQGKTIELLEQAKEVLEELLTWLQLISEIID